MNEVGLLEPTAHRGGWTGTNMQRGDSNIDDECQERRKHREMGTERKVSSHSPGAQGRLPGVTLKDKSGELRKGAAARVER